MRSGCPPLFFHSAYGQSAGMRVTARSRALTEEHGKHCRVLDVPAVVEALQIWLNIVVCYHFLYELVDLFRGDINPDVHPYKLDCRHCSDTRLKPFSQD